MKEYVNRTVKFDPPLSVKRLFEKLESAADATGSEWDLKYIQSVRYDGTRTTAYQPGELRGHFYRENTEVILQAGITLHTVESNLFDKEFQSVDLGKTCKNETEKKKVEKYMKELVDAIQ